METVQINVLKPFRFSYFSKPGDKLATEIQLTPGTHSFPADHPMLSHPWITEQFAGGRIESPAQAEARLVEARATAQRAADLNAAALAQAEAAFLRRVNVKDRLAEADQAKLERELNTPVSELRAAGQVAGGGATAAGADVDRPVNELREEQGAEPAERVQRQVSRRQQRV